MTRRRRNRRDNQRLTVAQEAARIMREEGIRDFLLAKRKAAQRLGVVDRGSMPGNDEIADALEEQQRLFGGQAYEERLRELRRTARWAMSLFEDFEPRLVGSLLTGAVTNQTAVNLHVFADTPEMIAYRLMERSIPYDVGERRVRYTTDRWEARPMYTFLADDVVIEAAVFPLDGLRQPPSCPVEGRPMKRLRLPELEALTDERERASPDQSLWKSST